MSYWDNVMPFKMLGSLDGKFPSQLTAISKTSDVKLAPNLCVFVPGAPKRTEEADLDLMTENGRADEL